jgi:hypothetical protein
MRAPDFLVPTLAAAFLASSLILPQEAFSRGRSDSCEEFLKEHQKYQQKLNLGEEGDRKILKKLAELERKLKKRGCPPPMPPPDGGGWGIIACQEDPGPCLRCLNGHVVPDNFEDPGMCKKCSGGKAVPDNSDYPGRCYRCEQGNVVYNNGVSCDDGDTCTHGSKCSNGTCKPIYNCPASPSTPCDLKYCGTGKSSAAR